MRSKKAIFIDFQRDINFFFNNFFLILFIEVFNISKFPLSISFINNSNLKLLFDSFELLLFFYIVMSTLFLIN